MTYNLSYYTPHVRVSFLPYRNTLNTFPDAGTPDFRLLPGRPNVDRRLLRYGTRRECFYMVRASGFEPNLTESKSVVLTGLHYAPSMFGSEGRDRTYDQLVNSQLHYRCATSELFGARWYLSIHVK